MMDWLRWYHGTATDPKWRVISKRAGVRVADVLAVWATMLEAASCSMPRGSLDAWVSEDVAAALDLETEQVDAIRAAMEGKVLQGESVPAFARRNPKREDGSAERAKAWRESKKNAPDQPDPNGNGKRTQPNAGERTRPLDKTRREEITTTDTLSNESGAAPRVENEPAEVINLAERRPCTPPDPAALMMPFVRSRLRLGQGWPGRNPKEQRAAEGRCLGLLRELIAKGRTPEDVADALRGAVLLRDSGELQRRGWVRIDQPMFTRILLKTSENGPSFWQEALDAISRSREPKDEPGQDRGGLQPAVIEIRRAG